MEDRAPDCATARAAAIAGILAAAVMAGEMSLGTSDLPFSVVRRFPRFSPASEPISEINADLEEGYRIAGLMISARARASVRTPDLAALSFAAAALALIEDALRIPEGGIEPPIGRATAVAIRDTLRAVLNFPHAAEGSVPAAA